MPDDPSFPTLTAKARKTVIKAVSDGLPYKHAAALAGVSLRLLYYWLAAGRRGGNPQAVQLVLDLRKARAQGAAARLRQITAAGKKHWAAHAWVLERTDPEHFGTDRKDLRELRKLIAELLARIAKLEGLREQTSAPTPLTTLSPDASPAQAGP